MNGHQQLLAKALQLAITTPDHRKSDVERLYRELGEMCLLREIDEATEQVKDMVKNGEPLLGDGR